MRFDGAELGHAWLAVSAAAGQHKTLPALYRTVVIEQYDDDDYCGVLIFATDRYLLLKAWVPEVDGCAAPWLGAAPTRTVIASDADKRANSLLGYVVSLVNREGDDYVHGQIQVRIDFDQRLPAGSDPQTALEGMEPTYVVLSVPDVERVYLEVVEANPPDWRAAVHSHVSEYCEDVTLSADLLERLAKVRKHASSRIRFALGGPEAADLIDFEESDPHVTGVISAVRPANPEEQLEAQPADSLVEGGEDR